MKRFDAQALKDKFGDFLSLCLMQGMDLDALSNKITFDPYFDFMERNDVASFMAEDNAAIYYRIFGSRVPLSYRDSFNNAAKWCGYSYITISVSLTLPLRKVFLLYPLKEAMADFDVYHEMASIRVIERFQKDFAKISAVKRLLEYGPRIPYGTSLAALIPCDSRVLAKLKDDPEYYLKAPSHILREVCRCEGWDEVFFRQSVFVPYFPELWNNEGFVDDMKKTIAIILRKHEETPIIYDDHREDFALPEHYSGILLTEYEASVYRLGKLQRTLAPSLFDIAVAHSIESLKLHCIEQGIAFC